MQVALANNSERLADLARRAERGETILLTRNGRAVAKIIAVTARETAKEVNERRARLEAIAARGQTLREREGFTGKQLQDDRYDENGAPA
jgi:antitoxin (DNA-binding transcriptional repressor) of toxin-antitoxin stability system